MKRRFTHFVPLMVSALSLLLGAMIYVGGRSGMRINTWTSTWLSPARDSLHRAISAMHLPAWVRFSLPDALWQFSFCLAMLWVWQGTARSWRRIFFCIFPAFFGVFLEIGQGLGIIEGVFDPMDLFLSVGAVALASLFMWTLTKRGSRHHETRVPSLAP